MSAKNCLVVVYQTKDDSKPYVVSDPKDGFFSRKEAQRQATARVREHKAFRAIVVEEVTAVNTI